MGHFKHGPASAAELEQKQIKLGQKKESLIQDIPTRWNSTLDMIKSVSRNKHPLREETAEMDKLQRLEMLLEPCRYILRHIFLTVLSDCMLERNNLFVCVCKHEYEDIFCVYK